MLGIGNNVEEALCKGLIASGYKMRKGGGVFITVRDQDKPEIGEIAKKFAKMGFRALRHHRHRPWCSSRWASR